MHLFSEWFAFAVWLTEAVTANSEILWHTSPFGLLAAYFMREWMKDRRYRNGDSHERRAASSEALIERIAALTGKVEGVKDAVGKSNEVLTYELRTLGDRMTRMEIEIQLRRSMP